MRGNFWYPWNYNAWLANTARLNLSLAARGALADLRDLCASNGSIPANRNELARLLYCERSELDEIWDEIELYFEPENGDKNRLFHVEIRDIMRKQLARRKSLKSNGKKGGRPKNQKVFPLVNQDVKANSESKGEKQDEKHIKKNKIEKSISPKGSLSEAFDTTDAPAVEKPTDAHWRRLVAIYPKATHITDASDAWSKIVEDAPDPLREADSVLEAARVIDGGRFEVKFLPNLRDFIAKKRYLEDWRAAANRDNPPEREERPWVAPWEREGGN